MNKKERERKAAEFAQYPEKQRARKAAEYAHNSKKEQERKHHVCKDKLSKNVYDVKPVGCLIVTERNCTTPLLSHSFSLGSPFPCRCPACTGCKPTFDLSLSSGAPDRR